MNQQQLAELLGVSIETLKFWRSSKCKTPSLRLLPDPPASPRAPSTYSREAIVAFLARNPEYGQRVLALLPQQPVGAGLLGLPQPTPDTEQQPC